MPRLAAWFAADRAAWPAFQTRLHCHFDHLYGLLAELYGGHYAFRQHVEESLLLAARTWLARPAELKTLDAEREADPLWFQAQTMVGGVCYVDRFAGTLAGVREKIPYFKELGLTYLHLMPLFLAPAGNSDGGYAVSSYREVNPTLGSMAELAELASELRHNGISLVVDFVFNHTADEHTWAQQALAGVQEYQDYYRLFPSRTLPDAYERDLREIFPGQRPGSFTYRPEIASWVWTTFNSFQWDLNYANPAVFTAMAGEMLFLANQGVEVLRLDAVAFIWKRLGTTSENLPAAHLLVQAFNALIQIAAPALLFKSEAIVHPDDVARYISPAECQISYNPLLMALLWEALATRETKLLQTSMQHRFAINPACAWVNYVRSHDDIGWTFDDEDAARVGINGFDHRLFLNLFYTGRFAGSFARGVPFQENPRTGDARVSGTAASLVGLGQAVAANDAQQIELAIRRVLLLYGVAMSAGGIPLIYLGDEVGTLNSFAYLDDPAKAEDSRWVGRPYADWQQYAARHDPTTVGGRIYQAICQQIAVRKAQPLFAGGAAEFLDPGNGHVLAYARQQGDSRLLALVNFSEQPETVAADLVRWHGQGARFHDLISGVEMAIEDDLRLEPYQFVWLLRED